MRGTLATLSAIVALLRLAGDAWAMDVTACGQVVPENDVGVLQVDLDCNGATRTCTYFENTPCTTDAECNHDGEGLCASQAVILGAGATLNLNGHSIVADGQTGVGVWCAHPKFNVPCAVYGPGDISGGSLGVVGLKLTIHDVSVHDTGQGIIAPTLVRATNVSANHNGMFGLYAGTLLQGLNVTASGNGGTGIFAVRIRGTTITASDNGAQGLLVYRSFRVTGLTSQNNGDGGLYSYGGGSLIDSVLTGNTYDGASLDVLTTRRPRLKNTTCGVSAQLPKSSTEPGASWGVCAGD